MCDIEARFHNSSSFERCSSEARNSRMFGERRHSKRAIGFGDTRVCTTHRQPWLGLPSHSSLLPWWTFNDKQRSARVVDDWVAGTAEFGDSEGKLKMIFTFSVIWHWISHCASQIASPSSRCCLHCFYSSLLPSFIFALKFGVLFSPDQESGGRSGGHFSSRAFSELNCSVPKVNYSSHSSPRLWLVYTQTKTGGFDNWIKVQRQFTGRSSVSLSPFQLKLIDCWRARSS